ncbi:DNA polymerase IV [Oceanisphaera arctica]|uniref:DNA polymerase IV n=1 Tax=Oceanisphaera arctica TaxID=641510 RepID=A0A2P5TLH5_9GAMM|nr:DNA polymerase IV [Oceanisphaera arctica]PPL16089.1 DNA polymerase IV [Oceanisphaera arctica]GHA26436.1 DNA polymerase IV [Oceanisphaera arctica]
MRKIIHVDMDCFFAAVEMRDHPEWRDIPLAIGGSASRRGVIATCNYPARAYGIRSAMASHQALQRCPQLLLIPGNMAEYKAVSQQIREIFHRYTELVEPLSLDEAYLDVSDSPWFGGSATLIAEDIRRAINDELQLTASAGVAPNKFLAKIASEENKPDGLFVLPPAAVADFVRQLPLAKLPGVGRKTAEKLSALGLEHCSQLLEIGEAELARRFGKFGRLLWQRGQGIDEREVQTERVRKSVGVETTLVTDIHQPEQGVQVLLRLWPELIRRLAGRAIKGMCIKLKFEDFTQTTLSRRCELPQQALAERLCVEAWERARGRGVRLVGVSVELCHEEQERQDGGEQLGFDW